MSLQPRNRLGPIYPLGSSQVPLFRLLGAPAQHKRHVLFDSGHVPPTIDVIKEILEDLLLRWHEA